jgi:hypothetical protein
MANDRRAQAAPVLRSSAALQPPCGSVRPCAAYRGELLRHRLITADGHDYVVATARAQGERRNYTTGAYPVARGYLVMMRQPLCELRSDDEATAQERHEQLVRVLAEAGVRLVRARRALAARHRCEQITLQESGPQWLDMAPAASAGSPAVVRGELELTALTPHLP